MSPGEGDAYNWPDTTKRNPILGKMYNHNIGHLLGMLTDKSG